MKMNNLIGVVGKKGVGKDTVATIINLLTINYSNKAIYQFIIENNTHTPFSCKYRIKRFAAPLKRFVADILGVPVEKLEDRKFKEQELGEEWYKQRWVNNAHVISDSKMKPIVTRYTPRLLLQQIGTDVGRNIHPNIWVNAMFKDYIAHCNSQFCQGHLQCLDQAFKQNENDIGACNAKYPKWIIPDVRFDNEAEAIKDRGGIVIRVNRGVDTKDTHASEAGVSDHLVDIEINNNGTTEELIQEVKTKLEL